MQENVHQDGIKYFCGNILFTCVVKIYFLLTVYIFKLCTLCSREVAIMHTPLLLIMQGYIRIHLSFSCLSERVAYLHVNSSIVLAASLKVG